MNNIFAIIGTLLTGGKFAGMTLEEIDALLGVIRTNEPACEGVVNGIKTLAPQIAPTLASAKAPPAAHKAAVHEWLSTIPGYAGDGSVTAIKNPDGR